MPLYNTFLYNEETYEGQDDLPIPSGRIPWYLREYDSSDVYELAINPLSSTSPSIQKTFTVQKTTTGNPVIFRGRDQVETIVCSGTILHEAHFRALEEWSKKSKQVELTDDLQRKFWIVITSFTPTRRYHASYPWRHEYSFEATVVDWR